ncbi:hypothetical protein ACLKA7_017273 [Drosophila subpalustris]
MKLLLLCSLALGLVASENQSIGARIQKHPIQIISNGYPAPNNKAPYIVSMALKQPGSNDLGLCGGSIIATTWILTGARCLETAEYADIHYGSNARWQGQFHHRVERNNFVAHQLYPASDYDIALIRTPPVSFSSRIDKIRLPSADQQNYENWWAVTCGWGERTNGQIADTLQCIDVMIASKIQCQKTYPDVVDGTLCIGTPGGSYTCGGDSGGPLVTRDSPTLVGVTSFGSLTGCNGGRPAAFTRVSAHLDWIRQQSGVAY